MECKAIINVSIGHWYPKGQRRLMKSIYDSDFAGTLGMWRNEFPFGSNKENIYTVKPHAFRATKARFILWVDSSGWIIKDTHPLFEQIKKNGYYIGTSGYNCAQTCSDKCLSYFGITRDEAEMIPDSATGVIGIDTESKIGSMFLSEWTKACDAGAFNGSREHDGQSNDKRFLFHRQDQSCASIIASKLGMKLTPFGVFVDYDKENLNETVCISLRGM